MENIFSTYGIEIVVGMIVSVLLFIFIFIFIRVIFWFIKNNEDQ